jgi:CPA1 family monovalent cation:H+ antiporter
MLLLGAVLGFLPLLGAVRLPPESVLLLFLPALLYWESLNTSLREIRKNAWIINTFAVGLVLVTALLVAVIGHALGLSWPIALVLAAVLSPTDATAPAGTVWA